VRAALLVLAALAACGPTPPPVGGPGDTPFVDAGATAPRPTSGCLRERGCPETPAIDTCRGRMAARPVAELVAGADKLAGTAVVAGGVLVTTAPGCTRKYCGKGGCCNRCTASVALADDERAQGPVLLLEGIACNGDDSRVCCDVPAGEGVGVVATGTLTQAGSGWQLTGVTLCAP
jgi:hypothetical protein